MRKSGQLAVAVTKKTSISVTTLQDLADLAGVSRATASRALSNSPLVNDKTKRKIKTLAKRHGYQINQRARDFRLRRSRVISVVFMLDVHSHQHMSDPFFLEMLGGIADCLAEHDYDLLLAHAPIKDVLELSESRVFRNSDGVVFIGQGEQHKQLNIVAEGDTPIVVWGGATPDKKYCMVGGENLQGGYLATHHLLKLGRRKIAFFGNTANPEIASRFAGYEKALQEFGLKADSRLQIDVPFDMTHARAAITEVVDAKIEFDAAVCSSDVMALSAIATLTELGLRVPEDVAIIGYDDIALAAYSSPALTTVRQNIRWAGRVLVESLIGLINEEPVTDATLASELIVRQSCGAVLGRKSASR